MLKAVNLEKGYTVKDKNGRKSTVKAVDRVSLSLKANQSYALVGESGSGKSTLARILTCIEKPTAGTIHLNGIDLLQLRREKLRLKRVAFQLVLQDSQSALDPRLRISDSIAEPLRNLQSLGKEELEKRVAALMEKVELPPKLGNRLPHELSGGQQKRVCIARAISVNPGLLIFDEAVSGLDVTVKKRILDLLLALRTEIQSTYLFITHDIEAGLYMARNILVMKEGRLVETAIQVKSYQDFRHEYTRQLIEALPPCSPAGRERNCTKLNSSSR